MTEKLTVEIDSILNSVKKKIGIGAEYEHFDADLIDFINTTFATLAQIGFDNNGSVIRISGAEDLWSTYLTDAYAWVRDYVFISAKLTFDPPTSGTLLENLKAQKAELEWRIYIQKELDEG